MPARIEPCLATLVGKPPVEYRAWTEDGKLRHASFKGLRELQDGVTIYQVEAH